MNYKKALKLDKRSYTQYYISLLRNNHLLIFSFLPNKDFNSRIIKAFLFFFYFAVHFTINALFFNDNTIHEIYQDKGNFNFIYQIPQIIYSSLISGIINALIKYLSLSRNYIIKFYILYNSQLEDISFVFTCLKSEEEYFNESYS